MDSTARKYKPLSLVKKNPKTAAVISKLVTPRERPSFAQLGKNMEYGVDHTQLSEMSQNISQRIIDSENIFKLFPDIEMASQILISSILSPKDMVGTNLIMSSDKTDVPADLMLSLLEIIEDNLNTNYSVKENMSKILKEMLFLSGAYVEAVIPENVIDQLINNPVNMSTEDINNVKSWIERPGSLGFLGNISEGKKSRFGLESLDPILSNTYNGSLHISGANGVFEEIEELTELVNITDDFRLLKTPQIINKARETYVKNIINGFRPSKAMEAYDDKKISNRDFTSLLYKSAKVKPQNFVTVPTGEQAVRVSVARPLIIKFPTESVIPIFTPGDPSNHVGYFVLIDGEGNPITKNILLTYQNNNGVSTMLGDQSASMSSLLLKRAKDNLQEQSNSSLSFDKQAEVYADIIEADLLERLKKGIYGDGITISKNNDVYRIMLARALSNQYTRLLYVPKELMTYFSFDVYDNGVGKSLIDDLRVMLSLRAIILFAKVMAMTKNAIATTNVNMTLSPDDPDPQKTIEMSVHEIVRMRQQYFPLGINSPVDLVDWVQRAGLQFSFEGHPGLPQVKFDFENKNMQFALPDAELDEMLRKQTYMAFGLSPETVDNGFNSEFATTVVSNNILLSKRILVKQEKFEPQITLHCKKIIHNDPFIKEVLIKKIRENIEAIKKYINEEDKARLSENQDAFVERYYEDFINNFTVKLPKPDITSVETQQAAFEQYSTGLSAALEAWISSEFMNAEVVGKLGDDVDLIKSTFKAYFLRKWMADNNYMPELKDIVSKDKDGNAVINLYTLSKDHLDGIILSSTEYIKSMQDMAKAASSDLDGIDGGSSESSSEPKSESDIGGNDFRLGEDESQMEEENAKTGEEVAKTNEDEAAAKDLDIDKEKKEDDDLDAVL